jgi:hypothetical protein
MPWNAEYLYDFQQMLIQQYMLHEVEHHALHAGNPHGHLTPIAHGMIDIYKCLHQGEFGVGHTIDNPVGFEKRLYQEIMEWGTRNHISEPAVENISADGTMLRINLRTLTHFYGDDVNRAVDDLTQVCIQSALVAQGDNARFFETLDIFRKLNQNGEIALARHVFAFPPAVVDAFLVEVRELMRRIRELPVFGHSPNYRRLNRPSYRVVDRSVLEASPMGHLLTAAKTATRS